MAMTTLLSAPASRRATVNPWSRASPRCEYHTESAPWSYVAATPATAAVLLSSGRIAPRPKPAGTTRSASEDPAVTSRAPEGPMWNDRAPGPRTEGAAGWAGVPSVGAGARSMERNPTANAAASAIWPRTRQCLASALVRPKGTAPPTSAYVVPTNLSPVSPTTSRCICRHANSSGSPTKSLGEPGHCPRRCSLLWGAPPRQGGLGGNRRAD